jgi:hypothetical protein
VKHLSSFTLDALALGSLSPAESAAAEAHLQSCPRCRADRDEAAQLRQDFSAQVLPRLGVPKRARRRWSWPRLIPILALPTAAAAALVLYMRAQGEPAIQTKGGPMLSVYARHADRVFAVRDGQSLQPADELRFVVAGAGRKYVIIASIDGGGHASIYYPFAGERSVELPAGKIELPGSVRLDETLGAERLYALFTDEPLEAADVLRALQSPDKEQQLKLLATAVILHFEKQP